jgi:glycosyltransferase involved in cell wall biosynthesis
MSLISQEAQVNVLLSTFNGEAYLHEQLQSLYQQTYPNIKIIVRDDGSSDSTVSLLKKEAAKEKLLLIPSLSNIGPAASFFDLLRQPFDASFFAFCDQDDIWVPQKIELAVNAIGQFPEGVPVMYFSRLKYVDSTNKLIKLSPLPKKIGFGNALVENIATGCTIVINKAAKELIEKDIPKQCLMHDSWCYLLISCMGKVIYDPSPTIHYRQHASNAIGASTSVIDTMKRRFKRLKLFNRKVFRFSDQAENFLKLYDNLVPQKEKSLLLRFVNARQSWIKRVMLAFSQCIWRQSIIDNIILRVLILFNRF